MGTETQQLNWYIDVLINTIAKKNNPLMGTESNQQQSA